jgi:ubiquinone/menaquinone biosynthesis C-methylase UbiE
MAINARKGGDPMLETTSKRQVSFACPKCNRPLRCIGDAFSCGECNRTYPIEDGIPDFLSGVSLAPDTLHIAKVMDFVAPIYESRFFVSVLTKLSGISGGSRFIDRIASFHSEVLRGVTGSVLDVACGPATYSRRIASPSRDVYGVDISMGVLRQGMAYVAKEGLQVVHLARASVEELPFEDAVFDGGICSGSLHLFPDTVLSLREIARTMKPGASLSVQTFIAGTTVVNRFVQKRSWLHTFELAQLQIDLTEAGFEEFRPKLNGIVLSFSARKATR